MSQPEDNQTKQTTNSSSSKQNSFLSPENSFNLLVSPLLSFFLFTSAFIVPVVGPALNIFSPLPLIYYFYTHGRQRAYIAAIAISVAVGVFFGLHQGGIFLLGYGLVAMVIAEMLLRKDNMNKILATATAIPLLCSSLFLTVMLLSSGTGTADVYTNMHNGVVQMLTGMTEAYKQSGMDKAQLDLLEEAIPEMAEWVITVIPSALTIFFLLISAGNYFGFRRLQEKIAVGPMTDEPPFRLWAPPEKTVFMLIGGAILTFLTSGGLGAAGANLLLLTISIYCLAGLAIMQFFLDKFKAAFFLRLLAYSIIMVQPVFLASVAGFGLFDIWLDFRKLRKGKPTSGDPSKTETEK